jgi:hypothetical protein
LQQQLIAARMSGSTASRTGWRGASRLRPAS